ncbi:dihydropteroate synthase [Pyxidicoccus parkwayensis]|uniref:dihydropteroate synthase n=1 Tax=Pyxidicoccus parkwayensis TaxID=2813578 RepID=A0ABX7P496_9BACT|nr:dihydropteroate synthase [Pyxidicoccus parkwaysis]QSQ25303.1 dihydropteroate synthase [Pyxidicoccus parkwaysis]
MIRARPIAADRPEDLLLAFLRMGLSPAARDELLAKLPHVQLLLTGLTEDVVRFLESRSEATAKYPTWLPGDARARPGTGLLTGRREQMERLVAAARARTAALPELATALERALDAGRPPAALELGGRTFAWGSRTYVMGIVNVTPDSFSDGGRFFDAEAAIAHGVALAEAGADLLDVGGESTRPGAQAVGEEEEVARVLPVIQGLRARTSVPLSVDTTKAAVAREALKAGAHLVNDVTGFTADPQLPRVVAEAGAACCLMHIQGTPATMQQAPRYDDLVDDVLAFLEGAEARAVAAGIARERILLDPGIGFGKTFDHNLFLLRRLGELRVLGRPLLLGTSRKGFLGKLTGGKPAAERLAATLGSVAAMAVLGGADVVRVHDVAEARDALAVADAIRQGMEGGLLYGR